MDENKRIKPVEPVCTDNKVRKESIRIPVNKNRRRGTPGLFQSMLDVEIERLRA